MTSKRRRGAGGAGAPVDPELTIKGRGHIYATTTTDVDATYGTVDSGSAPAAGDLVVWFLVSGDLGGQPINDLTGSGWAQQRGYFGGYGASMLAKVVSSGDISSPPQLVTDPEYGTAALWVAYTFVGPAPSLSVSTIRGQYSGSSAPSNQTCDSSSLSSPDIAITIGVGSGDDGTPTLTMTGATPDFSLTTTSNLLFSTAEAIFSAVASIGGANITFSKADDGGQNLMSSAFVSLNF